MYYVYSCIMYNKNTINQKEWHVATKRFKKKVIFGQNVFWVHFLLLSNSLVPTGLNPIYNYTLLTTNYCVINLLLSSMCKYSASCLPFVRFDNIKYVS